LDRRNSPSLRGMPPVDEFTLVELCWVKFIFGGQ
jgi:hypothetical protein